MEIATVVVISFFVALNAAIVLGMFFWAARKDGQHDDAVQRRLGIKRRTRLGPE